MEMIRAQGFLVNRQRTFVVTLRLRITTLVSIKSGEVVEAHSDKGMVCRKRLLSDHPRSLENFFRFRFLAFLLRLSVHDRYYV